MKQKLISMLVIALFLTISISSIANAKTKEETIPIEDVHLAAFGSSMLIGLRRVGFVMSNIGEHTYTDITWTFTAKQTENDEIVFTHSDVTEEFTPDLSTIFSVHLPFNVGLLDLTATASCSEFESDLSNTITVFQLGPLCLGRTFLLSSSF